MTEIKKDILKRYTSGNCTVNDERYVTRLFNDDKAEDELKSVMEKDWESSSNEHANHNLTHVLKAIHEQIRPIQKTSKMVRLYKVYARIAAILLLPLAILFVVKNLNSDYERSNQTLTTIQAMHGTKVAFTLPDGTKGWLKGGSELSYQTLFKQRHVNLSGEAYFDVAHDKAHPFEVIGSASKIVVLGTRFTADMWPDNSTTEVVLESGKVKFVPNNSEPTILNPGERLLYQRMSNHVLVEAVETEVVNSWVKGLLVFRGDNLKQVADKLGEWYNVEVVLEGDYPKDYMFRATFKNESIEEVLKLMALTAPIDYQITESKQNKPRGGKKIKVTLIINNNE
ncbi:DUF4974 domain-containing protein [Carboxylicivirga mesophila]|uniref:DUF4974 domain-containing protein n=1 Tax=Carboxylicivirga mesophila TaxID=1166478 RepID=A0ABS5KB84_9BACT|nr:FecR family protein [Carboxylicivirga mesophila]MBS2212092.1 DUF4974 domain-containing protein [Carboxylicivirga mesophila]